MSSRSPAPGNERVFLDTDDVTVTSTRLVIFAGRDRPKTYAMSQITSVQCFTIKPDTQLAMQLLVWGLITLLCVVGIVLLVIAVVLLVTAKPRYALRVRTAGAENEFMVGQDPDLIEEIVDAVNKAIVARG